jgi:cytoskeletal protein CcmA (bactofilin family)
LGSISQSRAQSRATVIAAGASIRGDIKAEGEVVIAGSVHGEVSAVQKIVIAQGGQVEGHLHAPEIVIDGKLVGDGAATTSLSIGEKGEVRGDLSTPSIVIASGATFVGRCSMPAAQG